MGAPVQLDGQRLVPLIHSVRPVIGDGLPDNCRRLFGGRPSPVVRSDFRHVSARLEKREMSIIAENDDTLGVVPERLELTAVCTRTGDRNQSPRPDELVLNCLLLAAAVRPMGNRQGHKCCQSDKCEE